MDTESITQESSSESVGDSDKSTTQGYPSSASSTPPPTFADHDRWQYHIELEDFTKGLQAAADAVFPNNQTSRYTKVFVLMLSWADEDPNLPVSLEIDRLNDVFQDIYHYETERWNIPAENCHYKLTEKIMDFVKPTEDSQTHLKIVYYAGHARLLDTRLLVWTSWQNNRKAKCPIVKWGGIQTILEEAPSDVLILLDCCASGTANASEGNGVNELISACAFNETANGVGPYSFTSALVTELRLLSDIASFSVGELYKRIFFRTQCRMPEEKYKDGTARERHPAPIHLLLTQGAPVPRSIQLSVIRSGDFGSSTGNAVVNANDLPGSTKDGCTSKDPEQTESSLTMQKSPVVSKGPRLIFAIRLKDTFRPEEDMFDHFTEWMRTFPTIAHEMKVEAVFDSLSTLLLVSLPMPISAYLPQDPAIISLGPITSSNRMHLSCTSEHNINCISLRISEQNITEAIPDHAPFSEALQPKSQLNDDPSRLLLKNEMLERKTPPPLDLNSIDVNWERSVSTSGPRTENLKATRHSQPSQFFPRMDVALNSEENSYFSSSPLRRSHSRPKFVTQPSSPKGPSKSKSSSGFNATISPTNSASSSAPSSPRASHADFTAPSGRLFDAEGNPTIRLGEFLRGIANHIMDESPKSLFITPSKMASIYARYSIDMEPHPLLTIFRAQPNEQISRLYQDLGCQHCLVQDDAKGPPVIPALTPLGFAHWESIHILSYPDEEWLRLSKVVHDTSIHFDGSTIGGNHELLPKQFPRQLFPLTIDRKSRRLLDKAIIDFLDGLGSPKQRRRAKSNRFEPESSSSSGVDLVQRHLRDQQMLKHYGDSNESVYSTSSIGSYARGHSPSPSSMIDSRASSVFSIGLERLPRPRSPPPKKFSTIFPEVLPHRASSPPDVGNRQRVAQALIAFGDRLYTAAPGRFDDSGFKHGKALDYPEIPGERQRNGALTQIRDRYNQSKEALNDIPRGSAPASPQAIVPTLKKFSTDFPEDLADAPLNHLFTCLLDTCTASCPDDCSMRFHSHPFRSNQEDEMKTHLDQEHPYHGIFLPLPESWAIPYLHTKSGWQCCSCGELLGTWDASKEIIEAHLTDCTKAWLPEHLRRRY